MTQRRKCNRWEFQECVFRSSETPNMRIFLIAISFYFDAASASGSSLSYRRIAERCGFDESTAKKLASRARDEWLIIEVGKGYLTDRGRTNLYHGAPPEALLASVRREMGSPMAPPADCGVAISAPKGAPWETHYKKDNQIGRAAQLENELRRVECPARLPSDWKEFVHKNFEALSENIQASFSVFADKHAGQKRTTPAWRSKWEEWCGKEKRFNPRRSVSRDTWESFLEYYFRTKHWPAPGPAPGQIGCEAPSDLIEKYLSKRENGDAAA